MSKAATRFMPVFTAPQALALVNGYGNVNVKLWAKGDGVTDDLAAFQLALSTGLPVYVPPGTYALSDTVTISTAGQQLFGAGPTSILKSTTTAVDGHDLIKATASHVTVSNLKLLGPQTAEGVTETGQYAVKADTGATYFTAEHLWITGVDASHGFHGGISIQDTAHNATISHVDIDRLIGINNGYGYGVVVVNSNNCDLYDIHVVGTASRGRVGIYLAQTSSYCRLHHCYIEHMYWQGILQHSGGSGTAEGNSIESNVVVDCVNQVSGSLNAGGITITGDSSSAQVFGNFIGNTVAGSGIAVLGENSSTGPYDGGWTNSKTVVAHNHIDEAGYYGILYRSSDSGSLIGNKVCKASRITVNTYADIWLSCDQTVIEPTEAQRTPAKNVHVCGNSCYPDADSYAPFELNTTLPVPIGIKLDGNFFPNAPTTGYGITYGNSTAIVDGTYRIYTNVDFGTIAAGETSVQNVAFTDAKQGDKIGWTSISLNSCATDGYVASNGTITLLMVNNTAGSKVINSIAVSIFVTKNNFTLS